MIYHFRDIQQVLDRGWDIRMHLRLACILFAAQKRNGFGMLADLDQLIAEVGLLLELSDVQTNEPTTEEDDRQR